MVYIYVLKLENNKWYIGKTDSPKFRLDQHFALKGSVWTNLHKPLEIEEIKSNCDENKIYE